jgi:hypothetical protein
MMPEDLAADGRPRTTAADEVGGLHRRGAGIIDVLPADAMIGHPLEGAVFDRSARCFQEMLHVPETPTPMTNVKAFRPQTISVIL